ncbi:MAG: macro domain-containing protein [Bdellovibrionia bacterium]
MMNFTSGDIFSSPAQVITNAVNIVGVMGAGLALEFKRRFPLMFEDYSHRCKRGDLQLGKPYLWEDDRFQILNFPTKRHWKDASRLEDVEAGLKYLSENYQILGIQSLALPALACGLGGLKWGNVRPLIEKYLGSLPDLDVIVYESMAAAIKPAGSAGSDEEKISQSPQQPLRKIAAHPFP